VKQVQQYRVKKWAVFLPLEEEKGEEKRAVVVVAAVSLDFVSADFRLLSEGGTAGESSRKGFWDRHSPPESSSVDCFLSYCSRKQTKRHNKSMNTHLSRRTNDHLSQSRTSFVVSVLF
jgi:hypothetical protein